MDPLLTSKIDQAAAELRDHLDNAYPLHAQLLSEDRSPWHDGAAVIAIDLLEQRADPEKMLLRLWAWDAYLHEHRA